MIVQDLYDLYLRQLRLLYDAEGQHLNMLAQMAGQARVPALRSTFQEHLAQTQQQRQRLSPLCNGLAAGAGREPCQAMAGLILDAEGLLHRDTAMRDAGMLTHAQHIAHYKIAGYGAAMVYAEHLGRAGDVDALEASLRSEEEAAWTLTQLAHAILCQSPGHVAADGAPAGRR